MPMKSDELLAEVIDRLVIGDDIPAEIAGDLASVLRAALAARPQPDEPGPQSRKDSTMPVIELDELLARTDYWLKWSAIGGETFELIRGLRAALAARPQPDEIERLREFVAAHDAVEELIADFSDDRDAYNAAVARFDRARRAAAGSATPTGDDDG